MLLIPTVHTAHTRQNDWSYDAVMEVMMTNIIICDTHIFLCYYCSYFRFELIVYSAGCERRRRRPRFCSVNAIEMARCDVLP